MSKVSEIVKKQASKSVMALNPQFFGTPMHLLYKDADEPSKHPISQPQAIAPHFMRQSTDESKLNKTERAYLGFLRCNNHHWIGIQCISLKLGDDCRYNPDFLILNSKGELEAHEVKGFMRDDALVKLKVFSRMYSFIKVFLVRKDGLSWKIDQVRP